MILQNGIKSKTKNKKKIIIQLFQEDIMNNIQIRNHKHIGCYGVMIKNEKIALIKKSRGAYTGKLDLPGGSFEHGETPEECVTREILEETGLVVTDLELIAASAVNLQWNCEEENDIEDLHHIGIFYKIQWKDDEIKKDADGLDSLGANWFDIKTLDIENISPLTKFILNKLGYDL